MQKALLIFVFLLLTFTIIGQRIERTINSSWEFTLDQDPNQSEVVNFPHTWNNEDAFQDGIKYYRGKGTYEKRMFIPDGWNQKQVFVKFEGANQITQLFVNDQLAGEHRGGYTGFVFDITSHLKFGEENQLKIICDNRHNPDIPPLEADFNFYGGVYRDVYLIATNKVHFELASQAVGNLPIRTTEVSEEKALVQIEGVLVNSSIDKKSCKIDLNILGPDGMLVTTLMKKVKVNPDSRQAFYFEYQMETTELWSPETPSLYRAVVSVTDQKTNELLDESSHRFGCRWFTMDPEQGFFLNGKHYKLIGVNRHQDYKGLGNALPNTLHEKDYRLMKAMGCNFVRIAHYPHDPEAYRLCDELGMLVWSEIPIINEVTKSNAFEETCLNMQREQVLQFFNHPSVVMWGYMNEIFIRMVFNRKMTESEKEENIETTLALAKKLEAETKKLDHDRLTVMALHNSEIYNATSIADITDVIGWNLYFGWYDKGLDDLGIFLDEQHKKYPDRPILISEYGPGADIRIQTDDPKPWDYSEAYQLKSHVSYYQQVMERPYVAGMAAWNFADFGSSGRQDAMPFVNQKGLLNFDRSSKDIYHYYQALLLKEPYVFIPGENRNKRFCMDDGSGKGLVEITVFSNAEEVELFINDKLFTSIGIQSGTGTSAIALPEGNHKITAIIDGSEHSRNIEVCLRSNALDRLEKMPLTINVGTHCDYTDAKTGEVWMHDQEYAQGSWGYVGGNVYQRSQGKFQGTPINILGTENDPLFQTMRENLEAYRFDVKQGNYRLTLFFAEPNKRAASDLIYNLTPEIIASKTGLRVFSVSINQIKTIENLNLAHDYGAGRAVEIGVEVMANDGIVVNFEKLAGNPVLSAIRLENR